MNAKKEWKKGRRGTLKAVAQAEKERKSTSDERKKKKKGRYNGKSEQGRKEDE